MKPFPFLGYRSSRSTKIVIWQVLPDGSVKKKVLRKRPLGADRWKVLLAVWPGKVAASPWHRESLGDHRVFTVLEKVVRGAPEYLSQTKGRLARAADLADGIYAGLEGHAPRAELVNAALLSMIETTKGGPRAVVSDLVLERAPALLGFDFDCDIVIHHVVAMLSEVKANMLPRSPAFTAALAERTRRSHLATLPVLDDAIDWSKLAPVTAALAASAWAQLANSFRETDAAHLKTLLRLSHPQRVECARGNADLATRMANAAALLLARGAFGDALMLYDAALEGELPSLALANPLYAVQNDNNGLGVDVERARRYLARCLPLGRRNPAVFLNAAFVLMELGEPDRAVEALQKAKDNGVAVRGHWSAELFAPLRERADFKELMAARSG